MKNLADVAKLLKGKKGQVGLNIFMALVVMLFVVGFLVMVFILVAEELEETAQTSTSGVVNNETINLSSSGLGTNVSYRTLGYDDLSVTIVRIQNISDPAVTLSTPENYTAWSYGVLLANATGSYDGVAVNVTYSYVYNADTTASLSINSAGESLNDTVDWFPIMLIIGAVVVLVFLLVIALRALKGSGILGMGGGA